MAWYQRGLCAGILGDGEWSRQAQQGVSIPARWLETTPSAVCASLATTEPSPVALLAAVLRASPHGRGRCRQWGVALEVAFVTPDVEVNIGC